ncbi:hypothetical protein [Streptococcus fryi]
MKKLKHVLMGLLAVSLMILLGVGIFLGQRFLLSSTPKGEHTIFKPKKGTDASSSVELVEKAVALLEEKQTPEALKIAQESVDKLSDSKEKTSFLARISVVQAKLKNKDVFEEAERAVHYLENNPDLSNISLAQEKVAKVTAPKSRKELEERIKLVQERLSQKEQPQRETPTTAQQDDHEVVEATPTPSAPVVEVVPSVEEPQPEVPSNDAPPVESSPIESETLSPSNEAESELIAGHTAE